MLHSPSQIVPETSRKLTDVDRKRAEAPSLDAFDLDQIEVLSMRPIATLLPRTAFEDHAHPLSRDTEPRLELGEGRAEGSQLADLADLLPGELRAVRFARHSHNATSKRLAATFPTAGQRAGGRDLR
jgi:hypothetical protein